jgi:hypothetical protein
VLYLVIEREVISMKITRNEVEKLLATMYKLEATEVELDISGGMDYTGGVDMIEFDIWKFGQYFTTALIIEEKR